MSYSCMGSAAIPLIPGAMGMTSRPLGPMLWPASRQFRESHAKLYPMLVDRGLAATAEGERYLRIASRTVPENKHLVASLRTGLET